MAVSADGVGGWFDYAALYDRVVGEAPEGALLVEVGVYEGQSLLHLADAARAAGKGLRVVGVDWGRGDESAGRHEPGELIGTAVRNLDRFGLSDAAAVLVAESAAAAELLPDAWMVFLDASHDVRSVRRDIEIWRPRVVPGGFLAGHDVQTPSVRRTVGLIFGDEWSVSPDVPNCWEWRQR